MAGLGSLFVVVQPVPTRGALRVVRGALLAATSAALAIAAHAVASGMLPSAGLTLLLTLGVAAGGTALADRQRGPGAVLLALGTAQLGMHLILSVAGHGGDQPVNGWLMTGGHALAVLCAAGLLARAEAALFAVASALGRLLPRRWATAPTMPTALVAAPRLPAPADRALSVLLCRCLGRRGPPVTC